MLKSLLQQRSSLISLLTRSTSNIKDLTFSSVIRTPKLAQLGISQLRRTEKNLISAKSTPRSRPIDAHQEFIKKIPSKAEENMTAAKGTAVKGVRIDKRGANRTEGIQQKPTEGDNGRKKAATEEVAAGDKKPKNSHFWNPIKKLSRAQMDQLRLLHQSRPLEHNIGKLAKQFGISPMAVKRILKSKFQKEPLPGEGKNSPQRQ